MICRECMKAADAKQSHAKCLGRWLHPTHCDCMHGGEQFTDVRAPHDDYYREDK